MRNRGRDRLGIVGIDEKRGRAFGRRPGKARQDENAGVFAILRGDVFLRHQVHAVAQRRHQPRARGAEEACKDAAAVSTIDVADRRPGDFAISTVDASGGFADRALHLGVFLDFRAAFRRDLQVGHLAAPIGIHREEALEGVHALRQPFGIIEPVDADHHGAPSEAIQHPAHQRRAHRPPCQAAELVRLDPNRKDADAHGSFRRLIGKFAAFLQFAFVFEIAREIHRVVLGLKADEIVGAQLRNEPLVVGQRGENFRRREWHVQKVSDAVGVTAVAQHFCQRNEMIVVHPDDVVRLQ